MSPNYISHSCISTAWVWSNLPWAQEDHSLQTSEKSACTYLQVDQTDCLPLLCVCCYWHPTANTLGHCQWHYGIPLLMDVESSRLNLHLLASCYPSTCHHASCLNLQATCWCGRLSSVLKADSHKGSTDWQRICPKCLDTIRQIIQWTSCGFNYSLVYNKPSYPQCIGNSRVYHLKQCNIYL